MIDKPLAKLNKRWKDKIQIINIEDKRGHHDRCQGNPGISKDIL
jgi:hypothetical protein